MGLSREQELFITTDNKNILVSASAGSGKTFSMIKKLSHILVTKRIPITSLLVVTYTNSAGNEIKVKLFNELTSLLYSTEDNELKDYLKVQLDNINNAEIGTIHSICKKLIKKYFYELGISPDFKLLEEERKYYLDNVIKDVFKKHIEENDDDFYDLYSCYDNKRNDESLKSIVLKIFDYKNTKSDYFEWKDNFLNNSYNLDINKNTACIYLLNNLKELLASEEEKIKIFISRCLGDLNIYEGYFYDRLNFVIAFNDANNFDQAIKIFNNKTLKAKPRVTEGKSIEVKEFDEEVKYFAENFTKVLDKIKTFTYANNINELTEHLNLARNNLIKLLDLVDEVENEFSKLKKNKNGLDFNDLENYMLELLKIDGVRDVLQNTYKYVFVDEYQDVNDKQEEILIKLTSGNNYYMIGDVKQSIYKFRNSSPKIFLDKYKSFVNSDNDIVIKFNLNFRSDKNILAFANEIFSKLITEKTIGINYKDDARFESEINFTESKVNVNLLNLPSGYKDKEKAECLTIASEINRILNMKKEDGGNYDYSDIAILLRNRGSFLKTLCDTLKDLHIPIVTTFKSTFFDAPEVNLIISILKVVSNYKNDIPLTIVLKNLFYLSEEELLKIRRNSEGKFFHECLIDYCQEDDILIKINNFKIFLERSKIQLLNKSIYEYLVDVLDEFDLIDNFRSKKDGDEKYENIKDFLALTENENYMYNVDKFLDYLEYISNSPTEHTISSGGNCVRITTMHSSKGLEYPAVIIGGMGKELQINKDKNNIIINDNFGIGLKSINSDNRTLSENVVRYACIEDNKKSQIDEEIRLLYVALTRPKQLLSLVGCYDVKNINKCINEDIYKSTSYFEMFFKCLSDGEIFDFIHTKSFSIFSKDAVASVRVISGDDICIDGNDIRRDIILSDEDAVLSEKIKGCISNPPSNETFTIKNTVTNILNEEKDYELINFMPNELSANDKVEDRDYLAIGTAYHAIMQQLKFNESKDEIEEIVDKLVLDGVINSDLLKNIYIDEIVTAKEVLAPIILNSNQIYQEKQFVMRENYNKLVKNSDNNTKVIIQGIIDLVVVNNEGAYLIDYKTNRTSNTSELINQYSLQLEIYKTAFEKATNIKISKKFLYSFYLKRLIEVE